jgi:hypothetical protein
MLLNIEEDVKRIIREKEKGVSILEIIEALKKRRISISEKEVIQIVENLSRRKEIYLGNDIKVPRYRISQTALKEQASFTGIKDIEAILKNITYFF